MSQAKITVTRHFSGFTNVADRFELGDHEHRGNASASEYYLPDGYSDGASAIYDPLGIRCEIVADEEGRPTLTSLTGRWTDTPLRRAS